MEEAQHKSISETFRRGKQIIFKFSINSIYLYKIKKAVKDIINKSNAKSIRF